jgi:hypothetical protein
MNIGIYGILIIFAAFIILMAVNPRLSCFGKKLKSPFYPFFRRKKLAEENDRRRRERLAKIKTEDYGFILDDSAGRPKIPDSAPEAKKGEDYGFKLD